MEENKTEVSAPKNESKSNAGVLVVNIILAIITILLIGYIAYKNGYINLDNILNTKEQDQEQEVVVEDEENSDTEEELLQPFEGEYISAVLPDGWRIVEYTDGDGSEMLVDGVEYTGLTGLKVFNQTKEIMLIEAVSGIGFVGCSEIPLFEDSSASYRQDLEDMNEEVGMDLNTLDYEDTEYSEFVFLTKTVRRVNRSIYYDTVPNNTYFEPQCEREFMTLTGIDFEDGDGYKGYAYRYEISASATQEELTNLDTILQSFIANN